MLNSINWRQHTNSPVYQTGAGVELLPEIPAAAIRSSHTIRKHSPVLDQSLNVPRCLTNRLP